MINYVENKKVNWQRVQELLNISQNNNKWTNFGPVCDILEAKIASILSVDPNNVLTCSNGTIALYSLVNYYQSIRKNKIKWVVSAFGFACTTQGPLKDAKVVDCDKNGFVDIKLLKKENFDGIIVTNPFGLMTDKKIEEYEEYCKLNNKILIFDCAAAFPNCPKNSPSIVSFHQTKPWGMGEGGCVITKEKEKLKQLINFGHINNQSHSFSTNGKMSDITAAYIIDRLDTFDTYKTTYQNQYDRIAKLAKSLGYEKLCDSKTNTCPPNLPLIAPINIENKNSERFVLQKYYKPLNNNCPMAKHIYKRIINIPCHTEMKSLSDQDIFKELKELMFNQPM